MRIVLLSDTHDQHEKVQVPDGDLLIHAGDFTSDRQPKIENTVAFNNWLGKLPHKHKIVIAGNHDFLFEKQPGIAQALLTNAIYLENNQINIEGLNIWGSPMTPYFGGWAFNVEDDAIVRYWDMIPLDTDILITHGPAYGIRDIIHDEFSGEHVGDKYLLEKLQKLTLKLHVFGHIHEGYGQEGIHVNAALADYMNDITNKKPIVFDI